MKHWLLICLTFIGCTSNSGDDEGRQSKSSDNQAVVEPETNAAAGESATGAVPEVAAREDDSQVPDLSEVEVGFHFTTMNFEVIAGDRIRVETTGGPAELSLYGITAPLPGEPLEDSSKRMLAHLLSGQEISVRIRAINEERGLSVDVKIPLNPKSTGGPHGHNLPPKLINGEMLQRGLARHDTEEAPGNGQLKNSQEIAQGRRRGIWDRP